jgi:hypothetical protein
VLVGAFEQQQNRREGPGEANLWEHMPCVCVACNEGESRITSQFLWDGMGWDGTLVFVCWVLGTQTGPLNL